MKKSQRLQVIIDLKENQEKLCLEALGAEQLKKQQKAEQLNNLQSYHQDYVDKNAAQLAKGLPVLRLLEFNAFLEKVDKAIEGERQALDRVDQQINVLRERWEKAHLHTKNIQKIQLKAKQLEEKELEKKEQLEMDERASRRRGTGIDDAY